MTNKFTRLVRPRMAYSGNTHYNYYYYTHRVHTLFLFYQNTKFCETVLLFYSITLWKVLLEIDRGIYTYVCKNITNTS